MSYSKVNWPAFQCFLLAHHLFIVLSTGSTLCLLDELSHWLPGTQLHSFDLDPNVVFERSTPALLSACHWVEQLSSSWELEYVSGWSTGWQKLRQFLFPPLTPLHIFCVALLLTPCTLCPTLCCWMCARQIVVKAPSRPSNLLLSFQHSCLCPSLVAQQ